MKKGHIFLVSYFLNFIFFEMAAASYLFRLKKQAKNGKLPPCDSKKLMDFLAEIQVVDPESIIRQATLNDLEAMCKKTNKGLENTHSYLKGCEPPFQKDLYLQLIKGVDSLHDKLCKKNGSFIDAFRKHHPCCHKTDYSKCTGPADWVEDSDSAKICSAYTEISRCYYTTTQKHCGDEAAKTIQELFDAVVASVITVNCAGSKTGLSNGKQNSGNGAVDNSTAFYLWLFYVCTIITLQNIKLLF